LRCTQKSTTDDEKSRKPLATSARCVPPSPSDTTGTAIAAIAAKVLGVGLQASVPFFVDTAIYYSIGRKGSFVANGRLTAEWGSILTAW
jgi:hypothetical protein